MAVRAMAVLWAFGMAAGGCSSATCGRGTKQTQDAHGNVSCVAADVPGSELDCDVDGGATIVAGHCRSRTTCGANTVATTNPDGTISCIGTAAEPHTPPPCAAPPTGSICVRGTIHHLSDDSFLSGEAVQVSAHDPFSFLTGDPSPLNTSSGAPAVAHNVGDTFLLPDVRVSSNLFAIAVGPETGDNSLTLTACGAAVAAGGSYTIDCYVTTRAMLAAWKTQSGIDYDAQGAYVAFFFADGPLPIPQQTDSEKQPQAGVKILLQNGSAPPMVHYFGGTAGRGATTIDTSLTQTGASGGAILPNNVADSTYTGMGGTYMSMPIQYWESSEGASAPGLVFVQHFHRCSNASCT